jgi:Ca2+-binding RTX toxin-like protein
VNEGVAWSDINGRDWLMENNIGIAYGAIIEDAKGGYGNDRINGNQAVNHFWGNGGADTFVIADYTRSNVPDPTAASGSKSVTDNSVDYVMDFNHAEGDKIDLASFGHNTVSNVSYDGSDLLTFTANGHNYAVHVLGSGFDVNTDIVYG